MLHFVAKWLISRSIDENRRPAGWLGRWIDRDDELRRFEILSRQLGDRLSDDARSRISSQQMATGGRLPGRPRVVLARQAPFRRRRSVAWSVGGLTLGTAVVVACAWFVIGRLHSKGERATQPDPAEDGRIVATAKLTAADRERVVRAWKTGHESLMRLRLHAFTPRHEMSNPPDLSPIVEPAEAAGSTVGQVLATLDRGMESEQEKLAFDAKAAFSFFAHRLPASIAKLVGWRRMAD
jgi:hypothetical protein